jgi:hypothetical protein
MALDVPYEDLARAEALAQEAFPDATNVKAIWAPASDHDVLVEVWTHDERTGANEGKVYAWSD